MKIILKSRMFAFILGAVLFGSIGVVSAYTIFADNIGYTPKDTTWKKSNGEDITNVKDAIDELYTKAKNNDSYNYSYIVNNNSKTSTFENLEINTTYKLLIVGINNLSLGVVNDSTTIISGAKDLNLITKRQEWEKGQGILAYQTYEFTTTNKKVVLTSTFGENFDGNSLITALYK